MDYEDIESFNTELSAFLREKPATAIPLVSK
ncbi:MAG: hypothetical protein MJ252_22890 [archaeon]|nr:hypothetical protein [archaeon]